MSLDWSQYKHFAEHEFACKCGRSEMEPYFLEVLEKMRETLDYPFVINSGFRCKEYNERLQGGPAHPLGVAADIAVSGKQAFLMVEEAMSNPITGIGLRQHGARGRRFIHLDMLDPEKYPRPILWTYQ